MTPVNTNNSNSNTKLWFTLLGVVLLLMSGDVTFIVTIAGVLLIRKFNNQNAASTLEPPSPTSQSSSSIISFQHHPNLYKIHKKLNGEESSSDDESEEEEEELVVVEQGTEEIVNNEDRDHEFIVPEIEVENRNDDEENEDFTNEVNLINGLIRCHDVLEAADSGCISELQSEIKRVQKQTKLNKRLHSISRLTAKAASLNCFNHSAILKLQSYVRSNHDDFDQTGAVHLVQTLSTTSGLTKDLTQRRNKLLTIQTTIRLDSSYCSTLDVSAIQAAVRSTHHKVALSRISRLQSLARKNTSRLPIDLLSQLQTSIRGTLNTCHTKPIIVLQSLCSMTNNQLNYLYQVNSIAAVVRRSIRDGPIADTDSQFAIPIQSVLRRNYQRVDFDTVPINTTIASNQKQQQHSNDLHLIVLLQASARQLSHNAKIQNDILRSVVRKATEQNNFSQIISLCDSLQSSVQTGLSLETKNWLLERAVVIESKVQTGVKSNSINFKRRALAIIKSTLGADTIDPTIGQELQAVILTVNCSTKLSRNQCYSVSLASHLRSNIAFESHATECSVVSLLQATIRSLKQMSAQNIRKLQSAIRFFNTETANVSNVVHIQATARSLISIPSTDQVYCLQSLVRSSGVVQLVHLNESAQTTEYTPLQSCIRSAFIEKFSNGLAKLYSIETVLRAVPDRIATGPIHQIQAHIKQRSETVKYSCYQTDGLRAKIRQTSCVFSTDNVIQIEACIQQKLEAIPDIQKVTLIQAASKHEIVLWSAIPSIQAAVRKVITEVSQDSIDDFNDIGHVVEVTTKSTSEMQQLTDRVQACALIQNAVVAARSAGLGDSSITILSAELRRHSSPEFTPSIFCLQAIVLTSNSRCIATCVPLQAMCRKAIEFAVCERAESEIPFIENAVRRANIESGYSNYQSSVLRSKEIMLENAKAVNEVQEIHQTLDALTKIQGLVQIQSTQDKQMISVTPIAVHIAMISVSSDFAFSSGRITCIQAAARNNPIELAAVNRIQSVSRFEHEQLRDAAAQVELIQNTMKSSTVAGNHTSSLGEVQSLAAIVLSAVVEANICPITAIGSSIMTALATNETEDLCSNAKILSCICAASQSQIDSLADDVCVIQALSMTTNHSFTSDMAHLQAAIRRSNDSQTNLAVEIAPLHATIMASNMRKDASDVIPLSATFQMESDAMNLENRMVSHRAILAKCKSTPVQVNYDRLRDELAKPLIILQSIIVQCIISDDSLLQAATPQKPTKKDDSNFSTQRTLEKLSRQRMTNGYDSDRVQDTARFHSDQAVKLIQQCIQNKEEHLDLSKLGLSSLPAELSLCRHVKTLNLGENSLSMLPPWFGDTFKSALDINLAHNRLFELPDTFVQLTKLRTLDLSYNKFEYFPLELTDMAIESLNVSHNSMLVVQGDIGNMKNLTYLDISNNNLMSLPEELVELKKLKALCIENNKFFQSEIANITRIFAPMLRTVREKRDFINSIRTTENLGYASTSAAKRTTSNLERGRRASVTSEEMTDFTDITELWEEQLQDDSEDTNDDTGEPGSARDDETDDESSATSSVSSLSSPRLNNTSPSISPRPKSVTHSVPMLQLPQIQISDEFDNVAPLSSSPDFILPIISPHEQAELYLSSASHTSEPKISNPDLADFHKRNSVRAAEMVDKQTLKELQNLKKTKKIDYTERIGLLLECLESERKYVKFLQVLYDLYYIPIVEESEKKSIFAKRLVPKKIAPKMFPPNLKSIIACNRQFLNKLEKRFSVYQDKDPAGLYFLAISDVYISLIPYLEVYISYLTMYEQANSEIRAYKAKNKQFETWVNKRKKKKESAGLDMASLLIMPVQRIPRYKILLENLLKQTSPDHGDYDNLLKAIEAISECAATHNEKIREQNNLIKVQQIAKMLKMDDLPQTNRFLIREGACVMNEMKQKAYLFTDIVVLREKRKLQLIPTVHVYSLVGASITGGSQQSISLQINSLRTSQLNNKIVDLIFDSNATKSLWMHDILAAIENLENGGDSKKVLKPLSARSISQSIRRRIGMGTAKLTTTMTSTNRRRSSSDASSNLSFNNM